MKREEWKDLIAKGKIDEEDEFDHLVRLIAGGDDAESDDEEDDPEHMFEDLEFAKRHLADEGAKWNTFVVYAAFLGTFLYHSVYDRSHAFHFAQYARDVGDVDDFMEIDDLVDYRDWLEHRFSLGCTTTHSTGRRWYVLSQDNSADFSIENAREMERNCR